MKESSFNTLSQQYPEVDFDQSSGAVRISLKVIGLVLSEEL
jgi:hypothetical protein